MRKRERGAKPWPHSAALMTEEWLSLDGIAVINEMCSLRALPFEVLRTLNKREIKREGERGQVDIREWLLH